MSKWISGHKIIDNKKIQPIELFQDYVQKGLHPHDQAGIPITPVDIVADINSEEIAKADRTPRPIATEGSDKVYYHREAEYLSLTLNANIEKLSKDWNAFDLSKSDDPGSFLKKLTDCLFLTSVYNAFGKTPHTKQVKLRPNQRHKSACRDLAKAIWAGEGDGPYTTVVAMSQRPAIIDACGGHSYELNTFYLWFRDINPNKSPGKRPKKQ